MSREPVTSNRIRRKSHKQTKHGPSMNKYAHLVPKRMGVYNPRDKTFRDLPVVGKPGEVIRAGLRLIFHGRLYELVEDTIIPKVSIIPNMHAGMGKFQFVHQFD